MRLILMYDLDISDSDRIKEYHKFHKHIISRGFVMMQFSVYIRAINSITKKNYEVNAIKKYLPKNGNVRIFAITDKQYYDAIMLRGNKRINETINTEQRRIKIYGFNQ